MFVLMNDKGRRYVREKIYEHQKGLIDLIQNCRTGRTFSIKVYDDYDNWQMTGIQNPCYELKYGEWIEKEDKVFIFEEEETGQIHSYQYHKDFLFKGINDGCTEKVGLGFKQTDFRKGGVGHLIRIVCTEQVRNYPRGDIRDHRSLSMTTLINGKNIEKAKYLQKMLNQHKVTKNSISEVKGKIAKLKIDTPFFGRAILYNNFPRTFDNIYYTT